ncbi:MAG: amidohydrolase family protein [Lentisphaeria bacterium]
MFIDAHAHAVRTPLPAVPGIPPLPTAEQLVAYYDRIGVEQGVLLPLTGPEVNLPQCNEDILEMAARHPGRFIPFCNLHPRALDNSSGAPLAELMRYYRQLGCKGIGEVTCNLPISDPYIQNFFAQAEQAGLPMTVHLAHRLDRVYGLYDQPGLPQLAAALERFPGLRILGHSQPFWAEISRLENADDRAGYPAGKVVEGVVPRLLRRFGNLYGDLSAGSGGNALMRDPEYAVTFIHEFQDRLLFGIDLCRPTGPEPPPLAAFLTGLRDAGKISAAIFDKLARRNVINLLGLA